MTTLEKTTTDLEWDALLEELANRCTSASGAERARALQPEPTHERALGRMRRTAEVMALAARDESIPIAGIVELGDFLSRLARDAIATGPELHGLRSLLRIVHTLRRFAGAHRESHPALSAALHTDPTLDRLLDTLEFAIDADGGLADRASADLAHARRKAGEVRQRLVGRLDELIARYAEVLQDRYYTLRDGRYVLPVRSDSHIRVPGIVLGSSASGATLFIEPRAVMSLGNQLRVAMADVEREESRVLLELTERARRHITDLERAWDVCLEADVLAAIARIGQDMQAVAIEPEEVPEMVLSNVRHPLLALGKQPVVPNDLELRAGQVLVISGPNAGGKTVALKCLGLAALMVRTGLPLPVDPGSRAGWFEPVLSDVGDDQSLARSLSTFSAHVSNLAGILERGRRGALVLLDELAGGTDPEEGSALAAAVLDRLGSQGAAVAVTTHYELLKTLPGRDTRFVNASVGFDLQAMVPTFRVTLGIPGASSALAVARRYGIPDDVLSRAHALLPEHSVGREDVLRKLHDEQRAAQMARAAAESEAEAARKLRVEIEAERTLQRSREQARISREGQDLLESLRRARDELRGAEARLRKKRLEEEEVRAAARVIDDVAARVAIGGALADVASGGKKNDESAVPRRAVREEELRPGLKVYVSRLASEVEVVGRPSKGHVRVAAGPLKVFVAVQDLTIEDGAAKGLQRAAVPPKQAAAETPRTDAIELRPMRTVSNTCDVRGLRSDDALAMVDSFVDRLVGSGESAGFVLHGHGTGALKTAVREHLRTSHVVERARPADPEDGGDAFTVLWIRA